MVSGLIRHSIDWYAPLPMWARNNSLGIRKTDKHNINQPSILRFATDTFMDDLYAVMQQSPWRIRDWVAEPETWRNPQATPKIVINAQTENPVSYLIKKIKTLADQERQQVTTKPGLFAGKRKFIPPVKPLPQEDEPSLKLYQAAHQRFYLVTASLINDVPGFPDHDVNVSRNEKVSFVLRRLLPDDPKDTTLDNTWHEYAFVSTSAGYAWKKLGNEKNVARQLIPGEEQLPLFPINYNDSCEHSRRLYGGLIPVGKRETWLGAPVNDVAAKISIQNNGTENSNRTSTAQLLFQTDVTEPWKHLLEQAQTAVSSTINVPSFFDSQKKPEDAIQINKDIASALFISRDKIQTGSWYVLLDFAKFLQAHIPNVWNSINGLQISGLLEGDEKELFTILIDTKIDKEFKDNVVKPSNSRQFANTLADALVRAHAAEHDLETVDSAFERYDVNGEELKDISPLWPDFLFPLTDPILSDIAPSLQFSDDYLISHSNLNIEDEFTFRMETLDELARLIGRILPNTVEEDDYYDIIASLPDVQLDKARFVVRCVYERPNCGPIFSAVVSHPTMSFELAPFFDPDAPARPIRIPMPLDISPAGLRKYKKNTAFIMSDMLCGQVRRIRELTFGDLVLSVLPWPFHKDLPNPGKAKPCQGSGGNIGMICSLSIPIVTLCALILLIIMVSLFDLFFRWIPYLFMCLPVPGLKGKK